MRPVDELAETYVSSSMALDPVSATHIGVRGHDDALTDLSIDGFAQRAELDRTTARTLRSLQPTDDRERVAQEAMLERLQVAVEVFDSGQPLSQINVVDSALHNLRGVFDLMPVGTEEAGQCFCTRLSKVPSALSQWRETLLTSARHGNVSSRQQILEVALHCQRWADPAGDNVFPLCAQRAAQGVSESLSERLAAQASLASEAVAATGQFLREQLAPLGKEDPAAGRDQYRLASRLFLGATVDLDETYAWAFEELAAINRDMLQTAHRIVPGGTIEEAAAALDSAPDRIIVGQEAFRQWMQDLADRTVEQVDGVHFHLAEPVRTIECAIAPTSDGGIYYTVPTEDFSRPGRMWWSVPEGVTSFSTWREMTTVYHEGVPGHHLQIGTAIANRDLLNRWQRLISWTSGHGEGWALYAERLMDELGHFQDPGNRLGMLDAQSLRAARVIIDIGLHCRLPIPPDNPLGFHPGERWTPELAWTFLRSHARMSDEMLRFELNRYIGWPGQASSYKIGERIWLAAREASRARHGEAFDLRAFHTNALKLGSLGLDPLVTALSRL